MKINFLYPDDVSLNVKSLKKSRLVLESKWGDLVFPSEESGTVDTPCCYLLIATQRVIKIDDFMACVSDDGSKLLKNEVDGVIYSDGVFAPCKIEIALENGLFRSGDMQEDIGSSQLGYALYEGDSIVGVVSKMEFDKVVASMSSKKA